MWIRLEVKANVRENRKAYPPLTEEKARQAFAMQYHEGCPESFWKEVTNCFAFQGEASENEMILVDLTGKS
jgi:hypothetical protein